MRRRHQEQETGAALIMVIGVIAALAVMAATITALTLNVKHNTARDRQQTKTFNVAEGVLDHAMAQLAISWPTSDALAPVFVPKDFTDRYFTDGVGSQYAKLQPPQAWFFDDSDADGGKVVNRDDYKWDANLNGRMYVEVQANNGDRTVRLRALVQQETISLGLPRGVAFYTASTLWTHGGSIVIGVDPGGDPPLGVGVKGYVGSTSTTAYTNDGKASYDPKVNLYVAGGGDGNKDIANVHYGEQVPPVEQMINPNVIGLLRAMAMPSNYYTSDSAVSKMGFTRTVASDPESITPMPPDTSKDDLSGIVFVETTGLVQWQVKDQFNSPEHPGILVIKGANLKLTGGGDYYGVIFVDGGTTDLGNVVVHGALICGAGAGSELGGSQTVRYNDRVWMNLNGDVTVAVRLVPNSWQELHPQ